MNSVRELIADILATTRPQSPQSRPLQVYAVQGASPHSPRSHAMATMPHVWRFKVDGKLVVAIDYERLCETEFTEFLHSKFGIDRVTHISRDKRSDARE